MRLKPSSAALLAVLASLALPSLAHAESFTYDSQNRLVRIDNGPTTTTLQYDAFGNLVRSCTNGSCQDLVLDDSEELPNVVAKLDSAGNGAISSRGPNGSAATRLQDGSTWYPLRDDILTARAFLRGDDGQGHNVDEAPVRSARDPYGAVRASAIPQALAEGLAGEPELTDNSMTWLRSRAYAAEEGAFVQRDTFPGTLPSPGLNRYAYALGNPVLNTDRTGYSPVLDRLGDALALQVGPPTRTAPSQNPIRVAPRVAAPGLVPSLPPGAAKILGRLGLVGAAGAASFLGTGYFCARTGLCPSDAVEFWRNQFKMNTTDTDWAKDLEGSLTPEQRKALEALQAQDKKQGATQGGQGGGSGKPPTTFANSPCPEGTPWYSYQGQRFIDLLYGIGGKLDPRRPTWVVNADVGADHVKANYEGKGYELMFCLPNGTTPDNLTRDAYPQSAGQRVDKGQIPTTMRPVRIRPTGIRPPGRRW